MPLERTEQIARNGGNHVPPAPKPHAATACVGRWRRWADRLILVPSPQRRRTTTRVHPRPGLFRGRTNDWPNDAPKCHDGAWPPLARLMAF